MDSSPMNNLPADTLFQIFSSLPLRQIAICRSVCKFFNQTLTSSTFLNLLSSAQPPSLLLALRPPHHHSHRQNAGSAAAAQQVPPFLHAYDPVNDEWLRLNLDFLPYRSPPYPIASAGGLVYFWSDFNNTPAVTFSKWLVVCNPLTRRFRLLPQLGSAWCKHGSVLVDSSKRVMLLTELAALYFSLDAKNPSWVTFSCNLPSKPRSPIWVSDSIFALCDVGSPWRPQWKLFACSLSNLSRCNRSNSTPSLNYNNWVCLEKREWADIFDIIKRPRLLRGNGNKLLMIGGLKSTFSLNPLCSTILILRLDLERLEWEEAGRMPVEMYRSFQESSKLKVFGGGDRVCFSAKKVGKLALWDDSCGESGNVVGGIWRWIDGVPGGGDELFRGFVFEATLTALP